MDEDLHSDKLLAEPAPPPDNPNEHHENFGIRSPTSPHGEDDGGYEEKVFDPGAPAPEPAVNLKAVNDVVNSDIGVTTLLNRLKQSLASAKEFATFLKKRSSIEEEHSLSIRKLARLTTENTRRADHRHGTLLHAYEEMTILHERMADNGAQFAASLHQMHDDLMEMAANIERGRKQWKASGLASEQRAADLDAAMRKSKTKYDSLADDYDRAKTGDRSGGKLFGIKGPKSAAQYEEDLYRKVQAADADYSAKVQSAQSQRGELISKLRPEAVKALQDLIKECDAALTLQMQKFGSFNEKLLLSNGLTISPLKSSESQTKSLRDTIVAIDNEQDLNNYISSFASKLPPHVPEIKYERNLVLNPQQSNPVSTPTPSQPPPQPQSQPQVPATASAPVLGIHQADSQPSSYASRQGPTQQNFASQQPSLQTYPNQPAFSQGPPQQPQHERNFSQGPPPQQASYGMGPQGHPAHSSGPTSSGGPPQLSALPFQGSSHAHPPSSQPMQSPYSSPSTQLGNGAHLPPVKPVFGVTLEQLFQRDGSAVPMVVYQCIQAIDQFGLEIPGIYRVSGTANAINALKAMFDNDASKVDFRNPENFHHDVNSVAGLLKQFFRDLPDPLLTSEHYSSLIEAARHEDDIVRRDSLHAIINSLPDPNYATLRALTLHLFRVSQAAGANRMNTNNLAIVFGPTLMGTAGPNVQDAGWQCKVVDTILQNTYQIFDED